SSKAEYHRADEDLKASMRRIRASGGARVSQSEFLATRARRDTSAAALKEALERIEAIGALVKDLDVGLIDFLTMYRGREVCICWKLGEEGIAFWHGVDEGFRGRKPIDNDFLQMHTRESDQH